MDKISVRRLQEYLRDLYADDDPVRLEMEAHAQERGFPIVGPLAGRHLYQLAMMSGAKRVFELGSGYGYSALFFARAAGEEADIHCTDLDAGNIAKAEQFLGKAGVWERVTYHQEEAISALKRIGGTWDVIYNDIDKEAYPDTVELAYNHLRPGGLFITDNVLWSGRVIDVAEQPEKSTQAIIEFTRLLFEHPGFVSSVYLSRDGLAVAVRR